MRKIHLLLLLLAPHSEVIEIRFCDVTKGMETSHRVTLLHWGDHDLKWVQDL